MPEIQYAKSHNVDIAYQVIGKGPLDLVFSPSPVSNLEVAWEWPPFERLLRRLASFSRLILFDKRGTGLSDRVTEAATLEERMDDLRAVMDAVGSERAAIFGSSEGGPMALLFAATYPARISALVLYGAYAKAISSPGYPHGVDADVFETGMAVMAAEWGHCALIDVFAPSVSDDEAFRRWAGRYERQSASPNAAVAIQRMNAAIDVRPILASVQAPTLVLYRAGEFVAHVQGSKYLAQHIPGATYAELTGADFHPYVGDQDAILDRVEEFLTGTRGHPAPDRLLATVLFIDIVDSTRRGSQMGDTRWREVLDHYDAIVERHLLKFNGHLVKGTGDGTLATFDGPARAISCALAVRDSLRSLGLELRAGVHTGEIELRGADVAGTTVNIAARVQAQAQPGQVLISRTLADLVAGSGFAFADRGEHELKGVPGKWRLFAVDG